MYDNGNNVNNGNVNNQNMNVGQPIFNNQQPSMPQQTYDNPISQGPQVDIPPELGQIQSLSQSTQYQAPSLDPLEPASVPTEPQDPLSNYEQTGQINNVQQVEQVAQQQQPVGNYDPNINAPQQNYNAPINSIEPIQTTQINDQNNFVQTPQYGPTTVEVTPMYAPPQNYGPQPQENVIVNQDVMNNVGMQPQPNMDYSQVNMVNPAPINPISMPMENYSSFNKDSYLVSREESEVPQQEEPTETPSESEVQAEESSPPQDMDDMIEDESSDDEELLDEDSLDEEKTEEKNESPEKSNVTVDRIKSMIDQLKEEGINIEVEEFDFEEMYQLVVKIKK